VEISQALAIPSRQLVQLRGDVPQAPSITIQPAGQTLGEGRKATLFVQASFPPKTSYQWVAEWRIRSIRHKSNPLPAGNFIRPGGEYSVVASNAFGSVTSEVAQVVVTPQSVVLGGTDLNYFNGSGADGPVFVLSFCRTARC